MTKACGNGLLWIHVHVSTVKNTKENLEILLILI